MFKRKMNINSRSNIYDTYYDMKLMYSFSDFQSDVEEVAGLNTAMFRYTQTDYLKCTHHIFPKMGTFS
jgi:hypothetical protein